MRGDDPPAVLRDLIVNLAGGWLDDPEATPEQVIEASWSEPAAKVLSWAGLAAYDESEEDEEDEEDEGGGEQ